jgi:hypothetical protein
MQKPSNFIAATRQRLPEIASLIRYGGGFFPMKTVAA